MINEGWHAVHARVAGLDVHKMSVSTVDFDISWS